MAFKKTKPNEGFGILKIESINHIDSWKERGWFSDVLHILIAMPRHGRTALHQSIPFTKDIIIESLAEAQP